MLQGHPVRMLQLRACSTSSRVSIESTSASDPRGSRGYRRAAAQAAKMQHPLHCRRLSHALQPLQAQTPLLEDDRGTTRVSRCRLDGGVLRCFTHLKKRTSRCPKGICSRLLNLVLKYQALGTKISNDLLQETVKLDIPVPLAMPLLAPLRGVDPMRCFFKAFPISSIF